MDIILGIDFGTTNTIITYFDNNKPNILLDGVFKLIKSQISVKDGIYTCGNYINLNNDEIIHSFKLKIGVDIDIEKYLIIFFNHLKTIIHKKFPDANLKTVITVPSNFNDIQREIIRNNFIKVGFDVIRIINEPSAAALSYGLQTICDDEEEILVLDLGGGTLDVTVLLKDGGFFQVLHSIGINDLGGNDFTKVIYDYILKLFPNIESNKYHKLWSVCQNAKEKLSWLDIYDVKIDNYNYNMHISKYLNLCASLINKLSDLLIEIKNKYTNIKYIILVGNASKMPIISATIEKIFNKKPWIHPHLDSVVSEGACLYGAILQNKFKTDTNVILVDVLPLSLGVETADGNFSVLIPKDTPLPIKKTQRYTIDKPGEKTVTIKVYQGESIIANKNILIGEFIFDKISVCDKPELDITFKVDSNSIISVIVLDKKSELEKNILIKNVTIFDQEELNTIIKNASINNNIDKEELTKKNRIYLISIKIENAMNNIKLNNLLLNNKKQELLQELLNYESLLETADNIELLKIMEKLDNDYINWINNNINSYDTNETHLTDNEKLMIVDLKEQLNTKINFLLITNPEWNEYLNPILEKLTLSNITLEYLQNKLEMIKELEDEENDHKVEFSNTCFFVKTQLEEGNIILSDEKKIKLVNLINNSLLLLDMSDINWEEELIKFNKECEDINN